MNTISRKEKLKIIKDDIEKLKSIKDNDDHSEDLSDDQIDNICSIIENITDNSGDHVSEKHKKIFDKTKNVGETREEKMMRVMLEIINKILEAMNKEQINNLCDFIDIRRDELSNEKYDKIVKDNCDYIFKNGFNKHECKYYQTNIKNQHLSILKGMLKQLGYGFSSKSHKKTINRMNESYTTYAIVKNI